MADSNKRRAGRWRHDLYLVGWMGEAVDRVAELEGKTPGAVLLEAISPHIRRKMREHGIEIPNSVPVQTGTEAPRSPARRRSAPRR